MTSQFEFGDILAALKDWDGYRESWLVSMKKAKQPDPTKEQIESLREIWTEAYLIGRTSK